MGESIAVQPNQRAALRIASAYAVVAVAWILLSDSFVAMFPVPVAEVMQTSKGLAFVVVTTLTLYVVISRFSQQLGLVTSRAASTERILTQVVETVPVGVVMTSNDGDIAFLNPAAEELLGLKAVEAVGRTLEEICFYDDPSQAASLGDLLRTGAVDDIELGYGGAQPSRTLIARAAGIDPDVPGSGWIVALADVTDAQHTRARMQRLAHGYRFLTESAIAMSKATTQHDLLQGQSKLAVSQGGFAGAWTTLRDVESGQLVDLGLVGLGATASGNAARLAQQFHTNDASLIKRMAVGDIYVNNDVARDVMSPWAPAAAEEGYGSIAVMVFELGGQVAATFTLFARHPGFFDADEIAMLRTFRSALAFALERLALDHRRLIAEEALTSSEAAYRELYERLPQPVFVFDRETLAFLLVNDAAVAAYGFSRDEFLGLTIADIRPPEDIPRMRVVISSIEDGADDIGIWTHTDREGRPFPVHIFRRAIDWEGRPAVLALPIRVTGVD